MPVLELVPDQSWPTLGALAVGWMEKYLCHGPGDVQGEPLFLNQEAAQFVYDCYRLYPKGHARAGQRVVKYGCLSEPKGFAKSELAGALCCFEFVGPCRFDRWDDDGSPIGKPVLYPLIRPLATEEGQTGHTFGNVIVMLEHAKENFPGEWCFDECEVLATKVMRGRAGTKGEIRPSTSGATSKDGGKETFVVADEIHQYVLPELISMHNMVARNQVKRKMAGQWMLATTTMFEPGKGSVAEEIYRDAEEQHAGRKKRVQAFCFHHRSGFPVEQADDEEKILASLAEAYAPVLEYMDPENVYEGEFLRPGSVWSENVRYFLNLPFQGENKAVDPIRWDELATKRELPDGTPVVLWFDGSEKGQGNDHTVLGLWTIEERPHCVLLGWWEPERMADGEWKIDRAKVRAAVERARLKFKVARFVADPHKWAEQLEAWEQDFGTDRKGDPIVLAFDTSKPSRMGPAIDRIREGLDESSFTHDGSKQLRFYALNALIQPAKGAPMYHALAKPTHHEKIDGLVGATLGYDELARTPLPQEISFVGGWR